MPPTPPSSRLCFLSAPEGDPDPAPEGGEEDRGEEARRSADCTRFSRGERGGSALFGRGRTSTGDEDEVEPGCSFAGGKACELGQDGGHKNASFGQLEEGQGPLGVREEIFNTD